MATSKAPLVFCGNMPQQYRPNLSHSNGDASGSSTPSSAASTPPSASSSSPDPNAPTTTVRGQFIVQSEVPSPASPPPESLVWLKQEEQKRLNELDAQLKRVFAQPGAGNAAATASSTSALSYATNAAAASGSAVVQYALGSTLLPQGIADLISNISLLARVSLKCSAFFIEVLIEAARLTTGAGLGITRRALISAVASARNVSSVASNMLPNKITGALSPSSADPSDPTASTLKALSKTNGPANHAFLTVLDRYTSLGIYLIHHTFTLAELFAMSGFYLTSTGIKMGLGAADESVRMLDQIFGSNETSRALSSFISLVRRELGPEGVAGSDSFAGTVKTMAYLTKAITAFAVLQNMTFRRSLAEQKLKVIYDCTVLGEAETNSWRAKLWGTGHFVPARKTNLLVGATGGGGHHAFSLLPGGVEEHDGIGTGGGGGGGHARGSISQSRSSRLLSRPLSVTGGTEFDVRQAGEGSELEDAIMADLGFYVGDGGDDDEDDDDRGEDGDDTVMDTGSAGASARRGRSGSILSSKRVRPAELTEEMRLALQQHGERELANGIIISQRTEPVRNGRAIRLRKTAGGGPDRNGNREVRRIIRKMAGERTGEVVFEMITEIVETTETTTTVEARSSPSSATAARGDAEEEAGSGIFKSYKWGRGFGSKQKREGGMAESSSSRTLVPLSTAARHPLSPSSGPTSPRSPSTQQQQQQQRKMSLRNNWLPAVFQPLKAGEKRTERDVTNTRSAVDTESIYDDRVERTRMEEDTWCEISIVSEQQQRQQQRQQMLDPEQFGGALQRLSSVEGVERARRSVVAEGGLSEEEVEQELVEGGIIPTSPNGAPAIGPTATAAASLAAASSSSAAAAALRDSLEHPDQSKARMQVVLKTMTKKLIQRKRILRKITVKGGEGAGEAIEYGEDGGSGIDGRLLIDDGGDADLDGDSTLQSGAESGFSTTHTEGLGFTFAGAAQDGSNKRGKGGLAGLIDFGSSPATSEGSRTPRGTGSVVIGGGKNAGSGNAGGSSFQRALGRARDAVRGSAPRSASGTSTVSGRGGAADSDVSIRSASSQGHHDHHHHGLLPSPPVTTSALVKTPPSERLLSPAPVVPTRARSNISASATPLSADGSQKESLSAFDADGVSASNRGSVRKGKRASRSTFGVPFLGAQYDPSVDGNSTINSAHGLIHSPPPPLSSRRHSRAPSITSVHSFTSRTHTHTNTTAHNSPYLGTSSSTYGPGRAAHHSTGGADDDFSSRPSHSSPGFRFSSDLGPDFPGEPQGSEEQGNAYFPHSHLVKNLHRFMRHSSAAYGQNFMRIFGIGHADYFFPDTSKHHANVWSFAHHVGLDVDKILLSSFTEGGTGPFHSDKMSPLVNYVSVDDESQAVVFTCRGTLGLSDILTDLTCTYEPISVPGGSPEGVYKVHAGMLSSARLFRAQSSTVFSTIRTGLLENLDYGLVLAGHSLGGGVCTVLAVLWSVPAPIFLQQIEQIRAKGLEPPSFPPITTPFVTSLTSGLPPGRPIHAYAYGPPATASADLSRYCRGLVTSLTHAYDMVPFLSLGSVRDLRNVAKSLAEERETDVAQEIVARTIGLLQHRRQGKNKAVTGSPDPSGTARQSITAGELEGYDESSLSQAQPIMEERVQAIELDELTKGRTSNRAQQPGYRDPNLARQPASGSSTVQDEVDADAELNQWLWAVIKTMRADMKEEKLFPPGHVYCIESFAVFVTPRMTRSSAHSRQQEYDRLAASKGQAHRVVLRYVDDVEKRFSELIWSMSMLRDHIPTNYEFCTQLLCESIVPEEVDVSSGPG